MVKKRRGKRGFSFSSKLQKKTLKILEYKKFKELSGHLGEKANDESSLFTRTSKEDIDDETGDPMFEVSIFELMQAFKKVLEYTAVESFKEITLEEISVEEKMDELRERLREKNNMLLEEIFEGQTRTKAGLIGTFLALLELVRLKEVAARQKAQFGEIRLYLVKEE